MTRHANPTLMRQQAQREKIETGAGFVAALDQSGGSTPKALRLYGIDEPAYRNEDEMYDLIHDMRCRIVHAPAFHGKKVVGAILFEKTMDRKIGAKPAAATLWEDYGVVPFLKVDQGLGDAQDGVQLMRPIGGLDQLLNRAARAGMFGTKMRAVISAANPAGIAAIVAQQFEIGKQIMAHGLTPILEPEVTISIDDKAEAEAMLLAELLKHLNALPTGQQVMLKLTLPEQPNIYAPLVNHPNVLKIVALSGGYSRAEANRRLSENEGIIASFSRALTEGLSAQQSDTDFNATLAKTIDDIFAASMAG